MSFPHTDWTRSDFDRLMGLVTVLADLSTSPSLIGGIPAVIAEWLDLEPTMLAIVRRAEPVPQLVNLAHSAGDTSPEFVDQISRRALDVYRSTRPLSTGETPAFRDSCESLVAYREAESELVVNRPIDDRHRLLLIVTYHGGQGAPDVLMATLDLVSAHLAKLLATLIGWSSDPASLGSPFDRLTEREWVVLQALHSEDGEKQLADRLELSPHTLHSHIKAIYRKLGVQGRLPVLMRLATAQRALRAKVAIAPRQDARALAAKHAIAVG